MARRPKQIAADIKDTYVKIHTADKSASARLQFIQKSIDNEYVTARDAIQKQYEAVEVLANSTLGEQTQKIEQDFTNGVDTSTAERDQAYANASWELEQTAKSLQHRIDEAAKEMGWLAAPWTDQMWERFSPYVRRDGEPLPSRGYEEASGVPGGVCIGMLKSSTATRCPIVNAPAMVPFIGQGHIVIISHGNTKPRALTLLQTIVTRLYCTFPINTVRTIRIDPLGLGDNFPFKRLPDILRGGNVSSEADEIRQRMRELTEHMRLVTEKYLAKDFENIEAYNRKAEEVVEPYRVLAAADFPVKFDSDACTRLLSIGERGIRTGVYVVMHIDGDQPTPRDFKLDDLLRYSNKIECFSDQAGDHFVFTPVGSDQSFDFEPEAPPTARIFNQMMDALAVASQGNQFTGIPFNRVFTESDPQKWWFGESSDLLEVPIGKAGAKDTLFFWLGQQPDRRISAHALLGGQTGSGKSTLLHVLINSLAMTYSPEELELYLLDFKEGVEFLPYADKRLPHARVIGIESEREFAVSVLRRLQGELEARAQKFKSVNVTNLKAYRQTTNAAMPRIVLIVDEFQKMFELSDAVTTKITQMIDDLAKRGRSFGIHIVMGSQSVRGANMPINSYGQFSTRIALQAPEQDITALLGSDNAMAVQLLERPGEVIYNDDGGNRNRNQRGQVVTLKDGAILDHLEKLHSERTRRDLPEGALFVFRGNEAAKLTDNTRMAELYASNTWFTPADLKAKYDLRDWITAERPALAWLGEAIEIKPHTSAAFKRRSRSNLLIVGDDEQLIFGMLAATFLSLPLFHRPEDVKFRIIDLSLKDEAWEDTCENFRDHFSMYDIEVVERRGVEPMIDQMASIVDDRYARYKAGEDDMGESIYFYVGSAHRSAALKPITGRMGNEPSDHAKKLAQITARGSEVGVHMILTCDNSKTFENIFGRQGLANFDRRVTLRMNAQESQMLLGEPLAESLRPFRALLLDDDASAPLEKFKPYAVPESKSERDAMFREYADKFKKRMN